MKPNKKQVPALQTKTYNDAEHGFTTDIDVDVLKDGVYVPLADGEYYISFSSYFKSRKLKPRVGLATFEKLGLIARDDATDHWLPIGQGWNYCVAKPGSPNHFGIYSGALKQLVDDHKIKFVLIYEKFEDPLNYKFVVQQQVSPTVKLPVLPIIRELINDFAVEEGVSIENADYSEVLSKLLQKAGRL